MSRRRRATVLGAALVCLLLAAVFLVGQIDRFLQQRSYAEAEKKLACAEANVDVLATADLSVPDFHKLCDETYTLADSALGYTTLRARALRVRFRVHAARLDVAGMKREIAEMLQEGNAKGSIDMLYSFLVEVWTRLEPLDSLEERRRQTLLAEAKAVGADIEALRPRETPPARRGPAYWS
jgi:hypothetical protein